MRFRYVAYNLKQGVAKGWVEAPTRLEAKELISRQSYKPLAVSPVKRLRYVEEFFPSLFKVKRKELVRFCRNMAGLLISGGNMVRVLDMLHRESSSPIMRQTLEDIRKALDDGGSLSDALKQHPGVFSPLFVSVVETGEHTGRLGPSLDELANILEQEEEAKQKAIRTLMYPLAIMLLAMATATILMVFALPPMLKVFDQMHAQVPMVTRIAMGSFHFVKKRFIVLFLAAALLVIVFLVLRRIPKVCYRMDVVQTRVPLVGALTISGEISRFSRTLAVLLESGVSLAMALRLGINGCHNHGVRRAFEDAEESFLSGHSLAEAMKKHPIIPSLFVELVMIGEESNSLRRTMRDASTTYEKQHDGQLNSVLGLMEPASTLAVGGVVALIAFSMLLPIYSGLDAIK